MSVIDDRPPQVHAQCHKCWRGANDPDRIPYRLKQTEWEWCCFCGDLTDSGIYVAARRTDTRCEGIHVLP